MEDKQIFIEAINSDEDFQRAVKVVEKYIDTPPAEGDPLNDKIYHMIGLIDEYQTKHFPIIDKTDDIDALLFLMDQQGLTPEDLVPCIGTLEMVSEVLTRRRELTEAMIFRLAQRFGDLKDHFFSNKKFERELGAIFNEFDGALKALSDR